MKFEHMTEMRYRANFSQADKSFWHANRVTLTKKVHDDVTGTEWHNIYVLQIGHNYYATSPIPYPSEDIALAKAEKFARLPARELTFNIEL